MRLTIPQSIRTAIAHHACKSSPCECCGLLAGHDGTVALSIELINERNSPTHFRTEAQSLFRAVRWLRLRELQLIAYYHSHPHTAAVPSEEDLCGWHAAAPFMVIFGTDGLRAWAIESGLPREVPSS
jgi:[CysO sulfur-carrier protein]-S-L-cysteine hydrolase